MEMTKEFHDVVGSRPLSQEELEKIQANETLSLPGSRETQNAVGNSIVDLVQFGLPDDYYETYAGKVRALKTTDLADAAHLVVHPDNLTWVIVGDRAKIEAGVREVNLGELHLLDAQGKRAEAESVWRELLSLWSKRGEAENPQRLYALRGLGETLEDEGNWSEAEGVWRESLSLWRKRGGIEERQSMYTLRKLGLALEAERKWPEAESVHREALAISRQKGDEDPEALVDLERVVHVLTAEKKFVEAQQLLDKILTPAFVAKPESASLLVLRVNVTARRGRWREAAADAALALENQLNEHYRYHTLAALLAMAGDRPAYEQVCKRLVTKFADSTNPYVSERIAQDYLLLPNSAADLVFMDKLADKAVTAGSGTDGLPYFQACKAMSHYRLGNFSEAIAWGEKAAKSSTGFAQAKAYAILAMAHSQLGQRNEALAALGKGDALAPAFSPEKGADDLGESWVAWVMARVSIDEATKLIQAGSTLKENSNPP